MKVKISEHNQCNKPSQAPQEYRKIHAVTGLMCSVTPNHNNSDLILANIINI